MEIDYVVAFIAFLFFAALAIGYYVSTFQLGSPHSMDAAADKINADILDYLQRDVYEIPARFQSNGIVPGKVLYFNCTWPFGQNSTRVYAGSTQLDCKIEGDAIHWQGDLHDGWNDFRVKFANNTENMNCSGTFDTADENQTVPWAEEKTLMIIQEQADSMAAMGYDSFKSSISAERDFRAEINVSGSVTNFGKSLPSRSDIYVRETEAAVFESGSNATVSVWVW
jgi:hypothetical protein